jgi:hypothetical protein
MYKHDSKLMGDEVEALSFLKEECGLVNGDALKFLKRYRQKKAYELLALSMETEVVDVEDTIRAMNEFIESKRLERRKR